MKVLRYRHFIRTVLMLGRDVLERVFIRAQPITPGHHASDLRNVWAQGLVLSHSRHVQQRLATVRTIHARHFGDRHELVQFSDGGRRRRLTRRSRIGRGRTVTTCLKPQWRMLSGGLQPAHRTLGRLPRVQPGYRVRTFVTNTVPVHAARRYPSGQIHAHGTLERASHAVR